MQVAEIRFYEELNDFLPPEKRKRCYRVEFPKPRSVKDLIESQRVPHTEVDLILVNGESVGFDRLVGDGDRVSVYPQFESLDIEATSRLQRPPLRNPQFVADVHLGKLVRRLRLLGFDCLWNPAWDDAELAEISAEQSRVLLTRDRGLLMRSKVTRGIFVRSDFAREQLRQVLVRLDLFRLVLPGSRCLSCNGKMHLAQREQVANLVPPYTLKHTEQFWQCETCGKVFWKGTHWPKLKRFIDDAQSITEGTR
jgi:uncharacterized protein with PIN domain